MTKLELHKTMREFSKAYLINSKLCPCCNGNLKVVNKKALLATSRQIMLECKQCGSNF